MSVLPRRIVNRSPDSFCDRGATWSEAAALDRVARVVDQGADMVDRAS